MLQPDKKLERSQLVTIARAIRTALSYDSREVRIHRLKHSRYIDVQFLMKELEGIGIVTDCSVGDQAFQFKDEVP